MAQLQSFRMIAEMKEFASLPAADQRYIRRSLDVGLKRRDAVKCWARNPHEAARIRAQGHCYRLLGPIRESIPDDNGVDGIDAFLATLITVSAFDLGEDKLSSFAAYRFLYERLLGGAVRPFLASAFCAAAALPYLHPERRRALLQSLTEADAAAPGWSGRDSSFFPERVEKVPVTVS